MTDSTSGAGRPPGIGEARDADLLEAGEALLSVRDLSVSFETPAGTVRAVDGVSFDVRAGETLCLVGESGSGKTVTCRAITGLVDDARATVRGLVTFDGTELTTASERTLRRHRGRRIAHVFQEPGDALDPVYTVGRQLREAIGNTTGASGAAARERMLELLELVEVSAPTRVAGAYPHELSGGQKQRVLVAMALSGDPDLLIADEPTAELDVTTQASLLSLFADLQDELGMAMLYVSHDFGVVAGLADRVAVMYAGTAMERGPLETVLERPAHPYTRALLGCLPGRGGELAPIEGEPPDAADLPAGCRFHPRCPHAVEACTGGDQPPAYERDDGPGVASCVFYGPDRDPSAILDAEPASDGATDGLGAEPADDEPAHDGTADGAGADDPPRR